MKQLTVAINEIPDFACWDERINKQGWVFSRIGGTHRDVTAIDASNHQVITDALRELDPSGVHWDVLRASHWAVGWYEHVIIDPNWHVGLRKLQEFADALDDYPILDESHLGQLEFEWHTSNRCDEHCPFEDEHCTKCGDAIDENQTLCDRHRE